MADVSSILSTSGVNALISDSIGKAKTDTLLNSVKSLDAAKNTSRDKSNNASLKQFEGLMISEMMKFMFEAVDVDENFGGGFAEEMTRSLMLDEYGSIMSKSGGLGISDAIQKQLLQYQAANAGPLVAYKKS